MRKIVLVGAALVSALLLSSLTATAAFAQDDTQVQVSAQDQSAQNNGYAYQKNKAYVSQSTVAVSGDASAAFESAAATGHATAFSISEIEQENEFEQEIDQDQDSWQEQINDSIFDSFNFFGL
jgi:hypothetical protein